VSDGTAKPRRRWLTIVLVLIVFVSGVVVGAGGATLVIVRRTQQAIQHPEIQSERLAERLTRRLKLRAEQATQVRAILTRRQQALLRIRAEAQPRVRAELMSVRDEVGGVLDSTQRARWDALFEDLSQRWMPPTTAGEAQ
jgi:hypothetical protein